MTSLVRACSKLVMDGDLSCQEQHNKQRPVVVAQQPRPLFWQTLTILSEVTAILSRHTNKQEVDYHVRQ